MAIYITASQPAAALPYSPPVEITADMVQGLFGALPADWLEEATDCNQALAGYTRVTKVIPNIPESAWPWGMLFTLSNKGAADGNRRIPVTLETGEIVYQCFYSTKAALFTRGGSWRSGWGQWVKRWEPIG